MVSPNPQVTTGVASFGTAHGGTSIAVTDQDLLVAQQQLARSEGIFVCPEGAACFAAVDTLRSAGWLRGDETVVVLNTAPA